MSSRRSRRSTSRNTWPAKPRRKAASKAVRGRSSIRRLDDGRHGAGAVTGAVRVGAVSVDLVLLELGVLLGGRQHDDPAGGVDLLGHLKAPLLRVAEQLLEHADDVL